MPPRLSSAEHKRKSQKGQGALGDLARFVKDKKLISQGLGLIPGPVGAIGSVIARQLGLGIKPKKRVVRRKQTGGLMWGLPQQISPFNPQMMTSRMNGMGAQSGAGLFSDLGGGIGSVFNGLGHGIGGIFGSGKRRVVRRNVVKM